MATTSTTPVADTDVPVVGPRLPCPCGSGKRYKMCHGRKARAAAAAASAPSNRPFEGVPGECDWVALREVVPAATATARLNAEHGGAELVVATVLPLAWPGLHRADGQLLVGLQTAATSGDPTRDLAAAILATRDAEPGTGIPDVGSAIGGPRLQDVLDLDVPFTVTVHEGFDFWMAADAERTPEVEASLEQANENAIPTDRLTSVDAAYWCRMGERCHLRWVMPQDEDALLDGIARLHAAGASGLGEGTRFVGSFRANGLLVPVWDLPVESTAESCEEPAAAFAERLGEALAVSAPLTTAERSARAGLANRQLTLR